MLDNVYAGGYNSPPLSMMQNPQGAHGPGGREAVQPDTFSAGWDAGNRREYEAMYSSAMAASREASADAVPVGRDGDIGLALASRLFIYDGPGDVGVGSMLKPGDVIWKEDLKDGGTRFVSSRGYVMEYGAGDGKLDEAMSAGTFRHAVDMGQPLWALDISLSQLSRKMLEQSRYKDMDRCWVNTSAPFYGTAEPAVLALFELGDGKQASIECDGKEAVLCHGMDGRKAAGWDESHKRGSYGSRAIVPGNRPEANACTRAMACIEDSHMRTAYVDDMYFNLLKSTVPELGEHYAYERAKGGIYSKPLSEREVTPLYEADGRALTGMPWNTRPVPGSPEERREIHEATMRMEAPEHGAAGPMEEKGQPGKEPAAQAGPEPSMTGEGLRDVHGTMSRMPVPEEGLSQRGPLSPRAQVAEILRQREQEAAEKAWALADKGDGRGIV